MRAFEPAARWAEIDAILVEALERPAEERIGYVRETTAGDPGLAAAVEELLRAGEQAGTFLERPIELDSRTWLEASDEFFGRSRRADAGLEDDQNGRVIGVWRIEREMGRGGMARVFLAKRTTGGFDQEAALKLLRPDLDPEVVERFRDERQILSNLSHPNIAKLLDGGSTDDGQPYLVMEAVDGLPITEWCDRRRLTVRERLKLFRYVVEAVRYAHGNLVVHRDLKPSNILVTADGRVKLLDFGIAQLIDPEGLPIEAPITSRLLLTPEYASPEQVTGGAITTASDTYQLGLLLFRLLTGTRPYEVPAGRTGLRKAVLESPPLAPSTAAAGIDDVTADARRMTPSRLSRRLRGDLDAIVLRAIRKNPADRHGAVADLDADLAAHLENRPVPSVQGGAPYRVRKFFRRNSWALPALVTAVVAVTAYVGVQNAHERQLQRERNVAQAEAARAEAVQRFMVELFRSADPWGSSDPERGRNVTVQAALGRGAERVRTELADQPGIQVELLAAIAGVYGNLGLPEEALPLLRDAVAVQHSALPPRAEERAALLLQLGSTLNLANRTDSAAAVLDEALEEARRNEPVPDTTLAGILAELGHTAEQMGDHARAERLLLEADSLLSAHPEARPLQRATVQYGLSLVYATTDRLEAAESAARRRVRYVEQAHGPDDPNTAAALVRLADVLDLSGRDSASIDVYREAVGTLEQALGEEHDATLSTLNNLAVTLGEVGREAEAEAVLRRIVDIRLRRTGVWDRDVGDAMQNLAAMLRRLERHEEALELLTRAHRVYETVLPEGHHLAAFPLLTRSHIELDRGDFSAAERTTREASAILAAALGDSHPASAMARCRLGRALSGQGRHGVAEATLRTATPIVAEATQLPTEYRAECLRALAEVLEATGRVSEAQPYRTATSSLQEPATD